MKVVYIILILFVSGKIFPQEAQNIIIKLLDAEDSTSVKYAEVFSSSHRISIVSDSSGLLYLEINKSFENDTLIISHVSYKTKIIPIKKLLYVDSTKFNIYLKKQTYILQNVTISSNNKNKKIKYLTIGPFKGHKKVYNSFNMPEREVALYFPNNSMQKEKYLSEISFYIYRLKSNYKFRLKIYDADDKKYPNKLLLNKDLIYNVTRQNLITVNIYDYYIKIPDNGIIISIEWLSDNNNKYSVDNTDKNNSCPIMGGIIIPKKNKKYLEYCTLFRYKNKWMKFGNVKTAYNWLFPAIKLKIYEEK